MKWCVLLLMLVSPLTTWAQTVIVSEAKVSQYRDAVAGIHRHVGEAKEIEPSDPDVKSVLKGASLVIAVGVKSFNLVRTAGLTVPIVFCMVLGANRGMLASNITGVPIEPDPALVMQQIKQVVPSAKRVGVVYSTASSEWLLAEAQRAASASGLTLNAKAVATAGDVKGAFDAMASSIDVFWVVPDAKLFPYEVGLAVLSASAERKLPVIGFLARFTESGAIASMHIDYGEIGDRAGKLALEILSKPEAKRIPVPPPLFAPGVLTVNLKTAKALGIEVSSKAISDAKQIIQ